MQYKQLTLDKRYQIKAFLGMSCPISKIAKEIKIHKSTIYRELRRNKSYKSYSPKLADEKSIMRRKYSKKKKRLTMKIELFIRDKLQRSWSPEQISGYCKKNGIDMVSHETIYQFIFQNKLYGGSLHKYLRRKGKKIKYGKGQRHYPVKNRVSIDCRPKIVEERSRIGDWEADLIVGENHKGAIVTLVERRSRCVLAKLLPNKTANVTKKAIIELLYPIKNFVHTITFDNGGEFASHEEIAVILNAKAYFAHPYSSWERGTNENTNGLIREFIPKKTSFEQITDEFLEEVISKINRRPKKVLGFDLPTNIFAGRSIV